MDICRIIVPVQRSCAEIAIDRPVCWSIRWQPIVMVYSIINPHHWQPIVVTTGLVSRWCH